MITLIEDRTYPSFSKNFVSETGISKPAGVFVGGMAPI